MSNSIIKVENLSKSYIIGHESRERYTTFRDQMTQKARSWFSFGTKEKIRHTTEEFWALKDINFDINQGDRVGIIGRNGAGKSTLLKILSRITEPTTGKITINGRVASLLEVGTGFHPELTGRENIFLNGAILGMSQTEIRKKFDEIVDFAEVEKFLDTPVKRYSSGMYVRLAFAVAAHLEPEILIVDEVLAVGDTQFQKKCLGKMQDVSKNEGRTVLFVSHNMGVISQLCQKSVLLQSGKMVMYDETRNVIDYYMLKKDTATSGFQAPKANETKELYIQKVDTLNEQGVEAEDFRSDEAVTLKIKLSSAIENPKAMISVTLQNNNGEYLSTFVESISEYELKKGTHELKVELQKGIIAPNSYAFRIALFVPNSVVYDLVEMICPVRIVDVGSKMAMFEGVNYGNFFIDHKVSVME